MDIESLLRSLSGHAVELGDLIEMERATGRPKDLEDLRNLLELKRRRDEPSAG